ncbi:multicopper oxidase domain-containing protein [Solihabitans fulvus]|uniref:Multicopper oxidase domain-containing protein n=1 Tax=Solihabitans fulvus TaxID=1892852 RepID=A0A5B2X4A4_9PSEU|nr:multicopper oxidase domain-containing protein [Solihabitans fulvus]KAA2258148.1 multicopper oxidase domain-containing protein [Solihabitans fulvus]
MTELIDSTVSWVEPRHAVVGEAEAILGGTLTPYLDPMRVPPLLRPRPQGDVSHVTVRMRATWARLHSELPPSRVWAYDGHFPGPTIEVRRGQRLRVSWANEITGDYPLRHVAVAASTSNPDPMGRAGRDGVEADPKVAALPPWTVVHLHGARTNAGNDGWAFNAVPTGGAQLAEYPNDQPAATMWYHDHAMGVTALNVQTGLAGMYLIRDDEEDALRLPSGPHEVPLILSDRNLDTTPDGQLTGQLLHKVQRLTNAAGGEVDTNFRGPFTLVNGTIWPHFEVDARWYRFRVLNAANGRFYSLRLVYEDGSTVPQELMRRAVWQIGTDSGLLPEPVSIPDGGLTLAPAERADLLVDFSVFRGRKVRFVNALDDGAVLEFRVDDQQVGDPFALPRKLSGSFVRLTHDSHPHEHRWLVLTLPASSGMPELWEMAMTDDRSLAGKATDGVIEVLLPGAKETTLLRRVAKMFEDTVNFFTDLGGWEQWNILNLGPITHPVHIHLTAFQLLSRDSYVNTFEQATDPAGVPIEGTAGPVTRAAVEPLPDNEIGWKDVIRVAPNQLATVFGRFDGGTGEFMYHCHILEHEDEGMMRPFVVMPREILDYRPMGGKPMPM